MLTQNITPIGYISTPFTEKFGIPRQPAVAEDIEGTIQFTPEYCNPDFLRGIEQFSHLWLIFSFHQHVAHASTPLVRPPRLGGNKKIGVFASRSSFRPNHIGLSLVRYASHTYANGQLHLTVKDIDLLNQTPILDIKPYIAYSDKPTTAYSGYAETPPPQPLNITYTLAAQHQLNQRQEQYPQLAFILAKVLPADPRPAYKRAHSDEKQYALRLWDLDILWHVRDSAVVVEQIKKFED